MKKLFIIIALLSFNTLCYAQQTPISYYTNPKFGIYAYYNCINNTVSQTQDFIHEMVPFKQGTTMYYCFKDKPKEGIKQTDKHKILEELQDKNPAIRVLYNIYTIDNGDMHFAMYMNLFSPTSGKPLKAYEVGNWTEYFWREGTLSNIDMYNWIKKQK